MQEFFVLFVQLFGGVNFKEKRKCKQLAKESCVCTWLVLCAHVSLPSWAPAVCPVILQPSSKIMVSELNGDRMRGHAVCRKALHVQYERGTSTELRGLRMSSCMEDRHTE